MLTEGMIGARLQRSEKKSLLWLLCHLVLQWRLALLGWKLQVTSLQFHYRISLFPSDFEERFNWILQVVSGIRISGFLDPELVFPCRCVIDSLHFVTYRDKTKVSGAQEFLTLFMKCHYISVYGYTVLVDLGHFVSFLNYTQSAGLLGWGISPSQGRYLHTE
jgi:hypothetical protein